MNATVSNIIKSRFGWANTVMISCEERVGRISNMQLQKLMYLSYAEHFAEGNDNFYEYLNFEAWKYGPVIPDIYDAYKYCHYDKIPDLLSLNGSIYSYDATTDISVIIDRAMDKYCYSNVYELVDLTHDNAWEGAFKDERNKKMNHEKIQEQYIIYRAI